MANRTLFAPGEIKFLFNTSCCFFQAYFNFESQVLTRVDSRPALGFTAKELRKVKAKKVAQDISEIFKNGRIKSAKALITLALEPLKSIPVINCPFFRIDQDTVGLSRFFKSLF